MSGGKGDKSRRKSGKARGVGARAAAQSPRDPFAIDALARDALKAARELLTVEDPLDAEGWASALLGTFDKLPVPFDVRERVERSLGPAIVQGAERLRNATGLAVLCALAGVTGDEIGAREAAARMASRGVPRPRWADVVGVPEFIDAWTVADPFGDQIGYYLTFDYPERPPHMVMALYDENLGAIIKDAFVATPREGEDIRGLATRNPDVTVADADPAEAAARISRAIATGDLFVDNDWTPEFKHARALLRARMRLLPSVELPQPPGPPAEDAREGLIEEFLASPLAPRRDEKLPIVDHCVIARCDYGDGDPLRWSPVVVELFMLDYLPRKATLSFAEIKALPEVLTAWVRFTLSKRGLAERFIAETEAAVARFSGEFRQAMTDHESFGPAKALSNAMRADGVDITDQSAVEDWLARFNARPDEERRHFFGRHLDF